MTKTDIVVPIRSIGEALLMSTHNICFHGEIRKKICGCPLLSGAYNADDSIRSAEELLRIFGIIMG